MAEFVGPVNDGPWQGQSYAHGGARFEIVELQGMSPDPAGPEPKRYWYTFKEGAWWLE